MQACKVSNDCSSIMKRYLFYYGYIGTKFRGVECHRTLGDEDTSIAKYLQGGLQTLNPLNQPIVYPSSRTDAGVHAICSTFHCDLSLRKLFEKRNSNLTQLEIITTKLNKYFNDTSHHIRIHSTRIVPSFFHCRHSAIQRTYLYRIAHRKNRVSNDGAAVNYLHSPIPELYRSYLVEDHLDVEAIRTACEKFKGTHDFRSFCKITNENRDKSTIRCLDAILVAPGRPLFNPVYDTGNEYEDTEYLDVIISARSFLYNQVRRIIAFLIAIGRGSATLEDLEAHLSKQVKWNHHIKIADAHGLYLVNVKYPPEAFLEPISPRFIETVSEE